MSAKSSSCESGSGTKIGPSGSLPSNSSEINLAGTDYVLVPKPILKRENELGKDAEDKKCQSVSTLNSSVSAPQYHPRVLGYRKAAQRGFVRGKNMMIADVLLTQKLAVTSAGSVDLTTVSALQPGSLGEFSAYQVLFDMCRVKAIRIHTTTCTSATPTVFTACGGVAYDPMSSSALSSVAGVMESKYSLGPFKASNLYGNESPNVATRTGFWTWKAKPPSDAFESGVSGDKVGDTWWPTATTSAIVGYLKPFIESCGTPTITLIHYIEYEMQFAYRT
jgi:hypothetical protein